jgi:hypothetical protein
MVDILLHVGIAVVSVVIAALTVPWAMWPAAFAGALVWVAREGWQNWGKWGNWFRTWSRQKKLEALVPSAAGLAVAALISFTQGGNL